MSAPLLDEGQPYPGLRAFRRDEATVFFGREETIDGLLARLERTRFLSVTGSSGSGKSSLVRTGMIEALESGFLASAGPEWLVIDMKPGAAPMGALADALAPILGRDRYAFDASLLRASLERGPKGLVRVLDDAEVDPAVNVLLLVDQFEELFRYKTLEGIEGAERFVALIIESARQRKRPIYVALTMRADFIGECANFVGLTEAISDGQFVTPRMTRDQLARAIEGPARVYGGALDPALTSTLLNDLDGRDDRLPILQHALMRMWDIASARKERPIRLTLDDYAAIGKLENALSRHADTLLADLVARRPELAPVAQRVFRAIVESVGQARDVRRPVSIERIAAESAATTAQVVDVVEEFRGPGRNFLTPPPPRALTPNVIVDISHESLIRQWRQLAAWTAEEARSAEMYRRLERTAELNAENRAALWGTPDLEQAIDWRANERPNAEWAKRYGQHFSLAMDFLARSEAHARDVVEEQREVARQKDQVRTRTRFAQLAAAIGVVALIGAGFSIYQAIDANRAREQSAASEKAALAAKAESDAAKEKAFASEKEARAAEKAADAAKEQALLSEKDARAAERIAEAARLEALRAKEEASAAERRAEAARQVVAGSFLRHLEILEKTVNEALDRMKRERVGSEGRLLALDGFLDITADSINSITMMKDEKVDKIVRGLFRKITFAYPEAIEDDLSQRGKDVADAAQLTPDQARIFEAAIARYEKVAVISRQWIADGSAENDDIGSLAYLLEKQGNSYTKLGRSERALAAHEEQNGLLERLVGLEPKRELWRRNYSVSFLKIGDIKAKLKDNAGAVEPYSRAVALRRGLLNEKPADIEKRVDLSYALERLALNYLDMNKNPEARVAFEEQVRIDEGLLKDEPDKPLRITQLAWSLVKLGDTLKKLNDPNRARRLYQQAVDLRRALYEKEQTDQRKIQLSNDLDKLAVALFDLNDMTAALPVFMEERDIDEEMSRKEPDNDTRMSDSAYSHGRVGDTLNAISDFAGARDEYGRALQQRRILADKAPNDLVRRDRLASALSKYSTALMNLKDYAGALAGYLEEELTFARLIAGGFKGTGERRRTLNINLNKLGGLFADMSDNAQARACYVASTRVARGLMAEDDKNPNYRNDLAVSLERLGKAMQNDNEFAGAAGAYKENLGLLEGLVRDEPDAPLWRRNLSFSYISLGGLRRRLGDHDGALAWYDKALDVRRQMRVKDPRGTQPITDIIYTLTDVAYELAQLERHADSAKAYAEVAQLRRSQMKQPPEAWQQTDLSVTLMDMGDQLRGAGDVRGARAAFTEATTLRRGLLDRQRDNYGRRQDLSNVLRSLARVSDDPRPLLVEALQLLREGRERREPEVDVEMTIAALDWALSRQDRFDLMRAIDGAVTQRDHVARHDNEEARIKDFFSSEAFEKARLTPAQRAARRASQLGGLAWYALFAGRPARAVEVTNEAVALAPNQAWLETNRAHALMYLGRADEAKALYLARRGQYIDGQGLWGFVIRNDFRQLKAAGRGHPQMAEIDALLAADDI